jgi:hypothetical protein
MSFSNGSGMRDGRIARRLGHLTPDDECAPDKNAAIIRYSHFDAEA